MVDTGLLVTLSFWDKDYTENVIYNKLLSDKLDVNLGYIYENMVAQILAMPLRKEADSRLETVMPT